MCYFTHTYVYATICIGNKDIHVELIKRIYLISFY